jgi:hypothetical protein
VSTLAADPLRQSVYSPRAGYEDVKNALERLDFPVLILSGRAITAPCGGQNGGRRICKSRDQKVLSLDTLNKTRKSEMEIPD